MPSKIIVSMFITLLLFIGGQITWPKLESWHIVKIEMEQEKTWDGLPGTLLLKKLLNYGMMKKKITTIIILVFEVGRVS